MPADVRSARAASCAVVALLLLAGACGRAPVPPAPAPAPAAAAVPTPDEYLGFALGADRQLADWNEVTGYLARLAQASPRVRMDTLGQTTLGRPFVMLTIADSATLARLDDYRDIQRKLADPRRIAAAAEAERLIAAGKTVVLITCSIHSTEVGSSQVPLRIAYRLAASDAPLERDILDNTILLLIPSLNPDGVQLVVDWYERTLGQPWEGASPPFLYHHYTGHDNNRDWYAFTQVETQLTIERAHNAWHPQIVHDIHQMGGRGARIFFPPYIDPIEPNVDPLLIQGVNQLGSFMAWELGRQGKHGVVINGIYDAWTPARAYQHYHAGVRILSETASATMASPVVIHPDSLQAGRGYDARVASWNFPNPWPGGEWRLRDIIAYQEAGAFALLTHAARNREAWLRSFLRVGENALTRRRGDAEASREDTPTWSRPITHWPHAWVIVNEPGSESRVAELLRILRMGGVEIHQAVNAAEAIVRDSAGERAVAFPAGSYLINMQQPYAAFAQTLLEVQRYPDLRLYPGGPPRRPYDVTAHTLPLLFNVRALAAQSFRGVQMSSEPIQGFPALRRVAPGLTEGTGAAPRIALYQSYAPSMDEGWTRWIVDQHRIRYATVHDRDVRAGNLKARYDVVVLPSQSPRGLFAGRNADSIAPEFAGGLGAAGVAALTAFVRAGGTLVTLEEASRFAIEYLELPLADRTRGLPPEQFYIPGSILRLELDASHPLAADMPASTIAWFGEDSFAFEARGPEATIVGRYGAGNPLLSGWLLGPEHVGGAGALADVKLGRGRVILFGFRPQYRAQSIATFPLLFNALRLGGTAARAE